MYIEIYVYVLHIGSLEKNGFLKPGLERVAPDIPYLTICVKN